MYNKKPYMKFISIFAAFCLTFILLMSIKIPETGAAAADHVKVGAIRCYAWVGKTGGMGTIADQSRKMLSPEKFRFRTPFFAQVTGTDTIEIETTQASMDQEIAYAKNGGVDYWAFQWYPQGSGFDIPLNIYLKSSHKNDVKFCYLLYSTNFQYIRNELPLLVSRMKLANYLTVNGSHPLVYLMHDTWTEDDIATLRDACSNAGLPSLYLVFMGWSGDQAETICERLGGQATSSYCMPGSGGQTYASLASAETLKWADYITFNYDFIPFVTTGWDPRPIGEYIASATKEEADSVKQWYPTNSGPDYFVQTAKPAEVAFHLRESLDFVNTHESTKTPYAVLIYAWNEFLEGGWICPVKDGGSQRLDAIKAMLDRYVAPNTSISSTSPDVSSATGSRASVASSKAGSISTSRVSPGSASVSSEISSPVSTGDSSFSNTSLSSITSDTSSESMASGDEKSSAASSDGSPGRGNAGIIVGLILAAVIIAGGAIFYIRLRN